MQQYLTTTQRKQHNKIIIEWKQTKQIQEESQQLNTSINTSYKQKNPLVC